jgi:Tfp pilus assembly protein PilN
MIKINLLPGSGKKAAARRQPSFKVGGGMPSGLMSGIKDKFMIVAVVGVVIGVGGTAFLYTTQQAREADLTQRLDKAVADSTRYANFLKDRYRSEAVRDTLLRQVNIIKSIDQDRFIWPHVLDEVSRALPQFTWLTSVGFTGTPQGSVNVVAAPPPKPGDDKVKKAAPKRLETEIPVDVVSIRLMGRTVDITALTRFMKDLEASPFLSNVQLDRSELAIDQGKEITQFQLTVAYSRPDTTMIRRAPLSLSVR